MRQLIKTIYLCVRPIIIIKKTLSKLRPKTTLSIILFIASLSLYAQCLDPNTKKESSKKGYQPKRVTAQDLERDRIQRKQQREQQFRELQQETERLREAKLFILPDYRYKSKTEHYQKAYSELLKMNPDSFSIKKANFIVENAYFNNTAPYESFDIVIKEIGVFLKRKMQELGYDPNNNLDKNLIIFQFFADTLELKSTKQKHYPFQYDFDDYMGHLNWESSFVSKLLLSNKGQCHSLPLLYLIIAEEIGAEAYLALAPNHSYIKFRDNHQRWVNLELTSNIIITDAFTLQSGYIKAEALQKKVYMQALSQKELLSQNILDLASGYIRKFGNDKFAKEMIEKAIELYPNSIHAHMARAELLTQHFEQVLENVKQRHPGATNINQHPKILALYAEVQKEYQNIDNLGHETMPMEAYKNWLEKLQEEGEKQDRQKMLLKLNQKKH